MGMILDYIEQAGKGKYQCFKTKKICLDSVDNDTIAYNYDDKTIANATKSTFAGNRSFSCKNSIHRIFVQVTQSSSTHFQYFWMDRDTLSK